MNQCLENSCRAFVAHHQAAEGLQPRVGALNDPSALIPSEFPSILMRGDSIVAPRRDDRLNRSLDQQGSYLVTVVATICNQPLGLATFGSAASDAPIFKRLFQQLHFRGGCLLHVYSERSTRAIGQYHELCSLASFSLPDQRTPFFAVMNMPSMKHSSHRTFFLSSSWSRKARHMFKSTSFSAHCFKRRCTVLLEPYRSGNSLHGAPVQRSQRMPSKHWRSSAGGRPPFFCRLRLGSSALINSHCLSETARQAIEHLRDLVSYRNQTTCQPVLG